MKQTAWILFVLLCIFIVLPILLIFKEHDLLPYVAEDRKLRLERTYDRLASAGAHYVIDGIWKAPRVIDHMNRRVATGEKP